jgi:K+-sensing histidine kinase KdpD
MPGDTVAPDTGGIYPDNDLRTPHTAHRTPLAAAQAAVSCLRCRDIQLTAEDHGELLATADESLDLLTHLVASG